MIILVVMVGVGDDDYGDDYGDGDDDDGCDDDGGIGWW
jgi:hypothetical protein